MRLPAKRVLLPNEPEVDFLKGILFLGDPDHSASSLNYGCDQLRSVPV